MATIFTVNYSGGYGSKYEFKAEASESNVSNVDNNSKVTVNTYVRRKDSSSNGAYNNDGTPWSITIDGSKYSGTSKWDTRNTTAWQRIGSASKVITHNSDGKKTISISATHTGNSASGASKMGNASGSGTFELTTIPRTSKVSLSSTNFSIGSSITINTNRASSSFTHTAVIKFNGKTVRTQQNIGGSYNWNTTELYQYITNKNSATGTVELTTYSGSTKIGSSSVSFTANVTNSNPTFSNYTYEDTGSVSTQLTGNNQILINGYNVLKVTISTANKAVAKNSATMSKYRLVCGNKSVEANYSSSANVTLTLDNITDMSFIVYAIDSRGNSTAVTKSVATWKNYSDIVIKTGLAVRTGGVGKETTLVFEGILWNSSFGAVTNAITKCQYKYKKSNENTYGELIDITPTISGGKFTYNLPILGDAGAEGFNLSNSYNIQVVVTDKISTSTYNILLGAGTPLMAIGQKGVAFGQPYDENISGALQTGDTIHTAIDKWLSSGGALNMHNSDIVDANSIFFGDESTDHEGINFLKQRRR